MTFLEIKQEIEEGKNWDVHINSSSKFVRRLLAEQGYKLDVLINDPSEEVRAAVAKKGYGLDKLLKDRSDWVRLAAMEAREAKQNRNAGYDIIHRVALGEKHFVVGHNPKAPAPYVTWQYFAETGSYHQGNYFAQEADAIMDLFRRAGESLDLPGRSLGLELLSDDDRMILREESEREAVHYGLSELLAGTEQPYDYDALVNNPNFMARAIHAYNNIDHSYENEAFSDQLEEILKDFPEYRKDHTVPASDKAQIKMSPEEAALLNALLQIPSARIPEEYGPWGDNIGFHFVSATGYYSGSLELAPSYEPGSNHSLSKTEPPHVIVTVWNCNTGDLLCKDTYYASDLNALLLGDYSIFTKGPESKLELSVEEAPELRRLGNTFVYRCNAEEDRYTKHDGELCTITKQLTPEECDILITGLMWEAQFPDGDILHIWDEELEQPNNERGEKKPSLDSLVQDADSRQRAANNPPANQLTTERDV